MLITSFDCLKDEGLMPRIKEMVASINRSCKKDDVPFFKINGPMELIVRARKSGATNGMKMGHAFMGGEEFRISSCVLERKIEIDSLEILLIFQPVDLSMLKSIVSLTLPLAESSSAFEGIEDWINVSTLEGESAKSTRKLEEKAVSKLPTVEAVRSGPLWGAW